MNKPKVLVIAGPTGTGKTELAIRVALAAHGEIVSADSMQVYKHMDIGTAKPALEERRGVPHHMIDVVDPGESYSVARYINEAQPVIINILSRGKLPIIVGGTGLYIDSLLSGRTFIGKGAAKLRKSLESRYGEIGGEKMLEELQSIDANKANNLFPGDKKRIVRAIEAFYVSEGKTLSSHDEETKQNPPKYDHLKFILSYKDRAVLYDAINRRVDSMISKGLEKEVSALIDMGVSQENTSMQAIGYKEILDVVTCGAPLDIAIDKIKMESRRYAKRQLTWFRRDTEAKWIIWEDSPDYDSAVKQITRTLYEA